MQTLNAEELANLLYGATALASGGGGGFQASAQVREVLLKLQTQTGRDLKLIDIDELDDQGTGFNLAAIGKPTEMQNAEWMDSVRRVAKTYVQATTGRTPDFIMCGETGINTFVAMVAAVALDIPITNADSAGRAMPTLGGSLYTANGLPYSPAAIANLIEKDSGLPPAQDVIRGDTIDEFQKAIRAKISTPAYGGGVATFANWGATGADLKLRGAYVGQPNQPGEPYATVCVGSVSFAMHLGYHLRNYLSSTATPSLDGAVDAMNEAFKHARYGEAVVRVVSSGWITHIGHTNGEQGFDFGRITTQDYLTSRETELRFLNETVLARDSTLNRELVMYPDIICYLDGNLRPTTNSDDLKVGDALHVLSIPARQVFKYGADPRAKKNLAAAAHDVRSRVGYDGPYVPVDPADYHYP